MRAASARASVRYFSSTSAKSADTSHMGIAAATFGAA